VGSRAMQRTQLLIVVVPGAALLRGNGGTGREMAGAMQRARVGPQFRQFRGNGKIDQYESGPVIKDCVSSRQFRVPADVGSLSSF
jgi:hypothetical protein